MTTSLSSRLVMRPNGILKQYKNWQKYFFSEVLTIEFCTMQLSVICLETPKLNGGSTVVIVEAKVALGRGCLFTLTVEPLWVGNNF